MELELKAGGQAVGQHPGRQPAGFQRSPDRREEHGAAPGQLMAADDPAGVFVVVPVGDHELDLVAGFETGQVFPAGVPAHARGGTLEVHDHAHARVHRGDVLAAVGLQQHREAGLAQGGEQAGGSRLGQRLAAGHLHQLHPQVAHPLHHFLHRRRFAALFGLGGVAPAAGQGTAGQTHHYAGPARPGGFALQAQVEFAEQHRGHTHGLAQPREGNKPGTARRAAGNMS